MWYLLLKALLRNTYPHRCAAKKHKYPGWTRNSDPADRARSQPPRLTGCFNISHPQNDTYPHQLENAEQPHRRQNIMALVVEHLHEQLLFWFYSTARVFNVDNHIFSNCWLQGTSTQCERSPWYKQPWWSIAAPDTAEVHVWNPALERS